MPTLVNRTRTIQVFNIPCRAGCDGKNCLCTVVVQRTLVDLDDGKTGTKEVERRCPGSIQFLAGEKRSDIPAWVVQSAPIKQAMARGVLRLLQD